MLHNKYFWILEQFLGECDKEVYGRQLAKKLPMSQKAIALSLDELEKEGILTSRAEGNMKYFRLNTKNTELRDILIMAELTKKVNFMRKHRTLANIFRRDERIVGIFGSYARGEEHKASDIDLFIIGGKSGDDYSRKAKSFDLDVSIKYFSESEFRTLLKNKNNLGKEMVKAHVMVFGAEKFISLVWRDFYGFD
ncbi:MAG: nucleotidyltransferase domain-containing protein [Nanoarchaeota archaeon]|nr:nucleotidyltransferase domain-containing protein [Nanoarchaeota archaeon]